MNIYTKFLVFTAVFLQFASFRNSFAESCEAYRFVKEEGKTLVNHVIKTTTMNLEELCWDACVWLPWCFSINVRHTSWGVVECELNNSSKKASPGSLVSREGTDYNQMGDVPEFLNQAAEVKRKEDLGDGWYRYGRVALKLFKDVIMTWLDARRYCQSLGGDLISISSHQENDFVHNVFVKERINNTNGTTVKGGVAHFKLDGSDKDIKFDIITGELRYEVADGRRGLYFSGGKALVEIPAVRLTSEFTIILWVRFLEPTAGYPTIFMGYPRIIFQLWLITSRKRIRYLIKADNSPLQKTNEISIEYGVWTHIAMSWTSDDSTTSAELAINGAIEATLNFSGTFSGATTKDTSTYTLGMQKDRFYGSDLYSFKGQMSNLKMFNRKLGIDEIKKDFAQSIDIPDLSAVWIGLNRTNHTSEFSWSDGSPHDYFTSLMASRHMKQLVTNHHCAASGKDGQWFGRHCLEKKPFICEKAAE